MKKSKEIKALEVEKKPCTFSAGDTISLNGEEYIKKNSMAQLDGFMLDNFHIVVHRTVIEILGRKCFLCGKDFRGHIKDLTTHHTIPKKLKAKYNVYIPFCDDCHKKMNKLYANLKEDEK